MFRDITLVGSKLADPAEGEEPVRFFYENKLHVAVNECRWEMGAGGRDEVGISSG